VPLFLQANPEFAEWYRRLSVIRPGIPEIIVSPRMAEAGKARLDYLLDGTIEDGQGLTCIPSGWASEVYRAMEMARIDDKANCK
jgi:hypothetical protein